MRRKHVSLRRRGRQSRVWLSGAASRRAATSALTIAVSLLALLGASTVPPAAAGTPQPDPYPTRAAGIVLTPTPDPAPAATMPPTPDTASPVRSSKPVVTGGSVVSAATTGTSAATTSPHRRQEAPSKGKKTGTAEGRPATQSGPVSRSRTAPGPAERRASVPTVPRAAAEADGLRLLPPAIALLALVIASGCLVQLLARSDGGRARV